MPSIAIELNDAEIRIAGPEGVRGVEPGCALLDGPTLAVGLDALRSARRLPAQSHDRFWSKLSHEPLPHPHPQAESIADLVFAQLSSIWSRFGAGDTDVVFVVPGWFERPQLGLLLGIAEACGIRTRGLVDAAVASSREPRAGRALAYVDAGLHEAALTRLDQDSGVAAEATEAERAFGLGALHDDWLSCIARAFLSQARFDPLHDAEAEQALFDRLPLCLDALLERESARVEIEIRGVRHQAELKRSDLTGTARPHYARLFDLVERSRSGTEPRVLQLSDRLARLPGLTEALSRAPDVETVALEPGAACAGALDRLDAFEGREGLSLVKRLDWPTRAGVGSPADEDDDDDA
ncbi:MAG: hypothetical protein JRG76_10180 [Deltaproteobacteria bacterium]|nr:hypothetical protein [Deltaproteobacteria bacterium]MBW2414863.1 hypothetical protein [Deltaproteobacteria bacterium]